MDREFANEYLITSAISDLTLVVLLRFFSRIRKSLPPGTNRAGDFRLSFRVAKIRRLHLCNVIHELILLVGLTSPRLRERPGRILIGLIVNIGAN